MNYYGDLGIFLYLTPIVACICYALALLTYIRKTRSQVYLAVSFLVICAGMMISFWLDRYDSSDASEVLRPTNIVGTICCTTSILFYFLALMQPHILTRRFLSRFICGIVLFASLFFFLNVHYPSVAPLVAINIANIFELGSFVYVVYQFQRYKKMIRENYSYSENINLSWIAWMMFLFFIFGVTDMLWSISSLISVKIAFNVSGMIVLTVLFIVGFRQGDVPVLKDKENHIPLSEQERVEQEAAFIQPLKPLEKQNRIEAALLEYFQNHSPYLDPNLSLKDVSEAVGVNEAYLSRIINNRFNINFYTFVNSYRIDHAIHLIKERKGDITSDLLYMESGFKSRSVFYKLFRERTSFAPQDYIRKMFHL